MKKLLILLTFLNCLPLLKADNFPTSNPLRLHDVAQRIKGTIINGNDGKTPIEFATVALQNKTTNKVIDGATTDAKGEFVINNVAEGSYKIVISFVGFSDKTLENITVTNGKVLDLGVIKLTTNTKTLDEVTVTSQKSLIEEKVDRTIYNAEKDLSAKGGDAADVLRKVPLLSVDLEGNVSIRGSSNIKVLINNKPSTIMASSVADALKQIPADMIKTVEVITSPSSRYDAEGATGIINIITKKNDLQGYFLNVDIGTGNRSSMLGVQGSVRKGKFGATLGGHGRAGYNRTTSDLSQNTLLRGISTTTTQTADAFDNPIFGRYNLGLDYDIDKNQSLSGAVRFGLRNFKRTQDQLTTIVPDATKAFTLLQNRYIDTRDLSNSVDVNLDYIHIYKPQQELSISTQFSRNDLKNNFFSDNLSATGVKESSFKNINLNLNQEGTIQIDYQTPLSTNQVLEFGGKGIYRQVNSDFDYLISPTPNADYVADPKRTKGLLDYTQKIGGLYTAYTFSTKKKYNFKAGVRYEYTDINAVDEKNKAFNIAPYGILVPSINVSKSLKEGTTMKLGYSRRIQRPGLQQLNPNFNIANPQSISVGNPNLTPEFTNNLELSVSTRFKQTFINVSLFGNQTDNGIMQIRSIYDSTGAIISRFENIGKQKNLGLNFFGNVYLTPKWTVNGGFDVMYNMLEGLVTNEKGVSVQATNNGFNGSGRLMSTLTLKNGWAVQGFGGMFGRRVQLQGTIGGMRMYSIGFRKDFKNKKGSIGLAGENFLQKSLVVRNTLKSDYLSQSSVRNMYNSGVRINLAYKFGKMGFEQKKKTRSVKNDDLKDGGGDNSGGGDNGGGSAAQPQQSGQGRPQGTGAPQQGGQGKPKGTGVPQQGGQGRPQGTGAPQQSAMPNGAKMPEKPAKVGEKPQEKKESDKGAPEKPTPSKQD
ncbi:MAG: outer membrane beta-barrel family protein [Saprospiraceae bacterium]|nr:outer membrane beta-barrel family protein [Saprospiraceae bacterium]